MKKIDKSKKSNRRCVNCKYWDNIKLLVDSPYLEDRRFLCEVSQKKINYWNCCKIFEWNPEKEYTDDKEALK